jgi:hypothetical protein
MIPLLVVVFAVMLGVGTIWRLRQTKKSAQTTEWAVLPIRGSGAQPRQSRASRPPQQPLKTAEANVQLATTADATTPSAMAMGRRRSDRVLINIPIEVIGEDLAGNSFRERAHTMVINRNGASFVLPAAIMPGKEIIVKNLQTAQSCRFLACRGGKDLPGGLREWAVECLDPAPNFWRISFPELPEKNSVTEETSACLLECVVCHYREMTRVTLSEYRATVEQASLARNCIWCGKQTEWKFAVIEDNGEATSAQDAQDWQAAVSLASGVELRREERRIVQLPILIKHDDGRAESTTTEDVSKSGIRCCANMSLKVGERARIRLASPEGPGEGEFRAQIMWRREVDEDRPFVYGMKLGRAA